MLTISSDTAALLISLGPVIVVMAYFMVFRQREFGRNTAFLIAFLAVTAYYIVTPDPSELGALYTSNGNYTFPIEIMVIASFLLLVAVFFAFKAGGKPEL